MTASSDNPPNKDTPIRILVLDFHTLFREGIHLLLEHHPEFEITGESGAHQEALGLIEALQPDITLLELNLDGEMDLEIIPELLGKSPETRLILLTGIRDSHIHHEAIQKGAVGVVTKNESSHLLLKAIEKVHAGEVWIDRAMMAEVLANFSNRQRASEQDPEVLRIAQLSDREREVIELIGEGLKNKEIAERLYISEVTVRHHLTSIYSKLGVSDRLELIIYAYQNELAELPG